MSRSDLDDVMDDAYWSSVIEPEELQDIDTPKPIHVKYIGEDKAMVVRVKEGNPRARSEGWPFYRDDMDYDPRMDEDWSEHDE